MPKLASRLGGLTTRLAVVAGLAAGTLLAAAPTSEAALSHVNTNPYATGCANTKRLVTSQAVDGGTASVYFSTGCDTIWIEYSGIAGRTVYKRGWDAISNVWTTMEKDTGSWNYSMQSYAPGDTKYEGALSVAGINYSVVCTIECSWSSSQPATKLDKAVDDFVAKWNGKWVPGDQNGDLQCADVPIQFRNDVVGSTPWSSASYNGTKQWGVQNWWYNAKYKGVYDKTKWTLVEKTSTARKGDVVVWKGNAGNGYYGHTALVVADRGSKLYVLSQNPGAAKLTEISKTDLLGYFRPKM